MHELEENVQIVLGKLLAKTEEIKEMMGRMVFRQDNLETRVETLEKQEAVRQSSILSKVADRGVWAVLAAVGALILKHVGIV